MSDFLNSLRILSVKVIGQMVAAHAVAAALCPSSWCCVWLFLDVSLLVLWTSCRANNIDSRQELEL